jgi:predicted GIY-YIG superfamily endonuclease
MCGDKMYCIYKATCKKNGKIYVGKTNDFERRKWEHEVRKNDHLFSRALQKYGTENFEWSILESGIQTLNESNDRERYWIKYFRSYFRWPDSNGFNMTRGGDGGSDWNLKKVAAYTLDGKLIRTFNTITECAHYYGIAGTSSISIVCNDNSRSCDGKMFQYFEDLPPKQITPYIPDSNTKVPICRLDLNGNFLETFSGIVDAEKAGYSRTGIIGCAKGIYKTSLGFQWCYQTDLKKVIGKPVDPVKRVCVVQYSLDGLFIERYNSCAEAARKNNFKTYKTIHKALSSKSHIAHGYKWIRETTHQ